uniref:uncharacterized protein LOC120333256 n=2 Tax=Styela clava TaxID=7725 RepID=UPI00193997B9|nr:uncharacterized protein LOC120333256 [Styela clava]
MTSQIVTLGLLLSLCIVAGGTGRQRICFELENVDAENQYNENRGEVQTIPGKKGPKGDSGPPGPKGSQGDVNYDTLEALINQKVNKAMEQLRAEMNETMNEWLESTTAKSEEQTTMIPAVVATIPPGFAERDIVRYGGRIFIPLASVEVRKASAVAKCQQIGGKLANIYSQVHMDKVIAYIRNNKMNGKGHKGFWLGMTYDPINGILLFRNGTVTSLSGLKFYTGYPQNGRQHSTRTNVYVMTTESLASVYQYIFNQVEQSRYVLCEI